MERKRPSELQYFPAHFDKEHPLDGLQTLSIRFNALRQAFLDCPENYCNDYSKAAEILEKSVEDLRNVAESFLMHECGGCRVCNTNLRHY